MNYKEVEGIDENGNPTTFKVEIPSAKEQLKEIENSYRKLKAKSKKDPFIHFYEMIRFKTIEKELDEGEKAKEILEIIKKYPRCSLQKYIGFNEMVKDGYELTQEHLFNHDLPCTLDEFKKIMEYMSWPKNKGSEA